MKKLTGVYRFGIREVGTDTILYRSTSEQMGREMLPRFARKRDVELIDREGDVLATITAEQQREADRERNSKTYGGVAGWL